MAAAAPADGARAVGSFADLVRGLVAGRGLTRPHRLEPNYLGPEVVTTPSPASAVAVAAWCGLVERMDRRALDRFTQDIWKRFDHRDLEPLKRAIIRRRRALAVQLRP